MSPDSTAHWTPRELEIVRGLAEGLTNRVIADRLGLAIETVRWYNKRLFERLGVSTRAEAAVRARALGLLDHETARERPTVAWSPIAFVNRDGCTIAYQIVGSGPIDVLFVHGFLSHLEVALDQPEYVSFFETLAQHARVVIFDKRGTGLSDRSTGAPSVEETIADMRAVLDAIGVRRAVIVGTSEGGAAAVLFASMHRARTHALVLIAATARVARLGAAPTWSQPMALLEASIVNWRNQWGQATALDRFAPSREHDPAFRVWWARALRTASSPASIRAVIEAAARVDIRAMLGEVPVRTLVVHRTHDLIVPVEAGRYLATKLPNARWVELPGADHIYFVDGHEILREIIPFIGAASSGEGIASPPESWLAIMMQMSGTGALLTDDTRALLAQHSARSLHEFDGGWTVLFESSDRALACARAFAARGRGRTGAIGLHVGECRVDNGRPQAAARAVLDRLTRDAPAGEIALSTTLYDIVNGVPLSVTPRIGSSAHQEAGAVDAWVLRD